MNEMRMIGPKGANFLQETHQITHKYISNVILGVSEVLRQDFYHLDSHHNRWKEGCREPGI